MSTPGLFQDLDIYTEPFVLGRYYLHWGEAGSQACTGLDVHGIDKACEAPKPPVE